MHFVRTYENVGSFLMSMRTQLLLRLVGSQESHVYKLLHKICLFIYLDNQVKEALLYRTTTGEYVEEIYEDFVNIMSVGIIIVSVTSDGHTSTLKAIRNANKWIKQQNK